MASACSIRVRGVVQGVGFRWWTQTVALELGLAGGVMNPRARAGSPPADRRSVSRAGKVLVSTHAGTNDCREIRACI